MDFDSLQKMRRRSSFDSFDGNNDEPSYRRRGQDKDEFELKSSLMTNDELKLFHNNPSSLNLFEELDSNKMMNQTFLKGTEYDIFGPQSNFNIHRNTPQTMFDGGMMIDERSSSSRNLEMPPQMMPQQQSLFGSAPAPAC